MELSNATKIGIGLVLLAVSSLLIFSPGAVSIGLPTALLAVGTLGLAVAALLVGTSEPGRPV